MLLLEDLKESAYLMEYADGVRHYVLMWYHQVFLPTYIAKDVPDSRINSRGDELIEKRIAVTTEQLAKATEIKQNKIMSKTQIRTDYIDPLVNQGYIDKIDSELDKRVDIYYPVILQYTKLEQLPECSNLSQDIKIQVVDSTIFPTTTYLKTSILTICNYMISEGLDYKIISPDKRTLTIDELVDRYYANAEDYFFLSNSEQKEQESSKTYSENIYLQTSENKDESQEISQNNTESISSERKISEKLEQSLENSNLSICKQSSSEQVTCPKCGTIGDSFWMKVHLQNCQGTD